MQPFLGQIQPVGFNFAPRGWSLCWGQLLPIAQNTALFSLLGTAFGGDGRTTFALPDLRGRSIVGVGNGPGLSNISWGERGGSEVIALGVAQLPSHNHTANVVAESGVVTSANAKGRMLAGAMIYADPAPANNKQMSTESVNVENAGGSQPVYIRNPYLGIYVTIALTGTFPSRS